MVLSPKSSKLIYRNMHIGSSRISAAQFVPSKSLGGDSGALCWQNTARLYFVTSSQVCSVLAYVNVDGLCVWVACMCVVIVLVYFVVCHLFYDLSQSKFCFSLDLLEVAMARFVKHLQLLLQARWYSTNSIFAEHQLSRNCVNLINCEKSHS